MTLTSRSPEKDTLFVGMTRPAMMMGVTRNFFILNISSLGVAGLMADVLWLMVLIVPTHLIAREVLRKDIFLADIWIKRLFKGLSTQKSKLWGAVTYDQF